MTSFNLDNTGYDTKFATETKDIAKIKKEVQQMEAELARLSRQASQPGQPVRANISAGQLVGTVGSTGN